MSEFSTDDIRAAVSANILTEAQASSLLVLSQERNGQRGHLPQEDEPFEFFRGFSEIFITVGLCLLFAGVIAFSAIIGGTIVTLTIGALLCLAFASYFTLKRRMSLPSIALASGFALFFAGAITNIFSDITGHDPTPLHLVFTCVMGMVAMIGYFKVFKLPFSMFLFGIFGFIAVYSGIANSVDNFRWWDFPENLFDLSQGGFAFGSILFGFVLFFLGIYFDTKDPNRLTRYSSTGFWLHIIAAPTIVNTAALSTMNSSANYPFLLTAALLIIITLVSLVIDRRSFLTAGIAYFGVIIGWALTQGDNEGAGIVFTLLILGAFITALGTWWVQIRSRLMRALPDFPYKDRLPPYSELS